MLKGVKPKLRNIPSTSTEDGKLVLINKSVTPMDSRADLVISGPIGEVLGDAVGV